MKCNVYSYRDGQYHEVDCETNDERVVDYLESKDSYLPNYKGEDKPREYWEGYHQALLDLVKAYDLADTIMDDGNFGPWLSEDETERRGF